MSHYTLYCQLTSICVLPGKNALKIYNVFALNNMLSDRALQNQIFLIYRAANNRIEVLFKVGLGERVTN